VDVEMFAVSSR